MEAEELKKILKEQIEEELEKLRRFIFSPSHDATNHKATHSKEGYCLRCMWMYCGEQHDCGHSEKEHEVYRLEFLLEHWDKAKVEIGTTIHVLKNNITGSEIHYN